jgi:stage II sporulation protein D
MKQYIIITAVFAALLFGTNALFGNGGILQVQARGGARGDNTPDSVNNRGTPPEEPPKMPFTDSVSVLLSETGEVLELSMEDYLVGCLFAQISPTFHEQALTAQAIAAHTYVLRLIHDGNLISDNPATCQPFLSEEDARRKFISDEAYQNALARFRTAAKYGAHRAVAHNANPNIPIYAVYHSLSAGVTNTAYSVWGVDFPYLKSVDSSWDREHHEFIATNEISAENIRLAMFAFNRTASMPQNYGEWFTEPRLNRFGYVMSVKVGENRLSGGDLWRALGLRSMAFEISRRDMSGETVFVIESRGFGHGVGLSQYGADVLGRRGHSYEDILLYYYTDVVLTVR